ncbi:MAG TPA: TCAD7 domain-containing protein [Intrasporangium sp.]|uniref:TCAD7 domain-containing protein n=1 Tax=Intrasporangium sp. TaxID=1925024 RepID=UPI002B47474D|nr:TCAD7 domain-containing protein [Intrasporangium sp.]HKX68969.1 TCAD7 domain-containing protein [Intrasporangium sp.]
MFRSAIVLPSTLTPDVALKRLEPLSDDVVVVIRREESGTTYCYDFTVGTLRAALQGNPAPTLTIALNLHEWQASPQVDLHATSSEEAERVAASGRTVVLDGDDIIGVLMPRTSATRGGVGGTRGGVGPAHNGGGTRGLDEPAAPAPPAPGGEPTTGLEASPAAYGDSLFEAFPRVTAPDAVTAGEQFDVAVGFSMTGAPGATRFTVAAPREQQDLQFVVSVMGHGLDFPDGVRRELTVSRSAPEAATVTFAVVADPVETDLVRVVEVSYEFGGNVVGRAWREVHVGATAPPAAPPPPLEGGTSLAPAPNVPAPHITVEVRNRQGDAQLEWLLHTRYSDVALPTSRITTDLGNESAREFAVQLMNQLPAQVGSPFLRKTITGIGTAVTGAMPGEFWDLFAQVWVRAKAAGEVPSVLIVTNEPYVPWELAWVGDDIVDPADLPPGAPGERVGMPLGGLCRVGRWVPPITRTPRGGDRPATPPPTSASAAHLAVVIGDYASDTNVRPLPEAIEEGKAIALAYGGLPLKATEEDFGRLLSNALERNGAPFGPTVVHVAAHGEVSPTMQQYTGIILSASDRRLDPFIIQGSSLTRETKPFVFLNACQVGTAGSVLSDYGGLAGAFVSEGCSGYVAPLWNVNDLVARQFAEEFYQAALTNGTSVAESLRQLRSRYATDWDQQTATPLAYVFYGHPELTFERS